MSETYNIKGQDGIQVFTDLPEGAKITLTNGAVGTIIGNPRDGAYLQVTYSEHPDSSLVGAEEFVFFNQVESASSK